MYSFLYLAVWLNIRGCVLSQKVFSYKTNHIGRNISEFWKMWSIRCILYHQKTEIGTYLPPSRNLKLLIMFYANSEILINDILICIFALSILFRDRNLMRTGKWTPKEIIVTEILFISAPLPRNKILGRDVTSVMVLSSIHDKSHSIDIWQ